MDPMIRLSTVSETTVEAIVLWMIRLSTKCENYPYSLTRTEICLFRQFSLGNMKKSVCFMLIRI